MGAGGGGLLEASLHKLVKRGVSRLARLFTGGARGVDIGTPARVMIRVWDCCRLLEKLYVRSRHSMRFCSLS